MKAGFLLSLTEPALAGAGRRPPGTGPRALAATATARERAHLQALQWVARGPLAGSACRVWDELLVEHPRDALALQWAQLFDFYRGDAVNLLRQRPARALPEWDEADPLHPHVLALYAFGLEENHLTRRPRRPAAAPWPRTRACPGPCMPWPT
jgi:hypothetical protein